jgi:DNA topoisomerase-1
MAQIEKRMMKRKIASLMPDQNIGNIGLEEALNLFLLPKDLGNIKRKKFRSVMVMDLTFVMELLCVSKRRKPLDVDFERAKELIDEKAIADAPVAFYKGRKG